MRAKILTIAGLAIAAAALPAASFAGGTRVGVSIAIGGPPVAYFPPPPVVYVPAAPIYFPPPVVVFGPPVAVVPRPFYAPPPTVVFRARGYYSGPGYYGHGKGYYGGGRWH